jgi:hypothetical protein
MDDFDFVDGFDVLEQVGNDFELDYDKEFDVVGLDDNNELDVDYWER